MSLKQFRSFLYKFLPAQREGPVKWGDLLSSNWDPELVPPGRAGVVPRWEMRSQFGTARGSWDCSALLVG